MLDQELGKLHSVNTHHFFIQRFMQNIEPLSFYEFAYLNFKTLPHLSSDAHPVVQKHPLYPAFSLQVSFSLYMTSK